jgi:phage-related minor tail protein
MALTVGELVAYVEAKDRGFQSTVTNAGRTMSRLQTDTTTSTRTIETTVDRAFAAVAESIATGLDPNEALVDVQRLADGVINTLNTLEPDARAAGEEAGDALVRSVESAVLAGRDDAEAAGRRVGDSVGDGIGDGADQSGERRMPGVADGLIGSLKGAGWLAAGTAIGSVLLDGIATALEREDLFAKMSAQLGASAEESQRFGRLAGELYADAYGESLEEVTGAVTSVVRNLDGMRDAGDETLKTISARALDVAKIMDEEVGAVTRSVSQLLRTGLAKDAEEAFDVIVTSSQRGLDSSGDLLDSLNEYSTQFRTLGIDAKTALGLVQQGLQGGARDSDVVVDTIKEFAIEAVQGGDKVKQGFKDLGLDADKLVKTFATGGPKAAKAFDNVLDRLRGIEDPVKRNAIAIELFGTKAEDMAGALFALDPSKAVEGLGQVEGAAKSASDTLNSTASSSVDKWTRGWEEGIAWVGDLFLDMAMKYFPDPTAAWAEISGFFTETVSPFFADTWESVKDTTVDIWNDTMDWLADVPGDIGDFFSSGWETVKTETGNAWDGITSTVTDTFNDAVDWLESIPGEIADFFSSGWNTVTRVTSESWEKVKTAATEKADELVTWVEGLPGWIVDALGDLGRLLWGVGEDAIQGLINGIKSKAAAVSSVVSSLLKGDVVGAAQTAIESHSPSKVFERLGKWTVEGFILGIRGSQERAKTTMTDLVALITNAFKAAPTGGDHLVNWVKLNTDSLEALASRREQIIERIANAKKYAADIASDAMNFASITGIQLPTEGAGVSDLATGLANRLRALKDFATNIKDLASRGLNKTILQQIIDAGAERGGSIAEMLAGGSDADIKAINKIQTQINKVSKTTGKTAADAMYDTGKQAGAGFLKGLQGQLKELEGAMAKIAKAVVAAAKKELASNSPSKVFMGIGADTMTGFQLGVRAMAASTTSTMTDAMGKAINAASGMSIPQLQPMTGPTAAPAGPGFVEGQQGGTTINMYGTTIREEADIQKFGAEVAFDRYARG